MKIKVLHTGLLVLWCLLQSQRIGFAYQCPGMAVEMVSLVVSRQSARLGVPTADRLCDRNCKLHVSAQFMCSSKPNIQVSSVLNPVRPQQQPVRLRTPPAAKKIGSASQPKEKQPSRRCMCNGDLSNRNVEDHVLLTQDRNLSSIDAPSSAVSDPRRRLQQ